MKTITLQFADPEDLRRVERYIEMAKNRDGTVTGLWAGLMCSALKRSETVPDHSPELLKTCRVLIGWLENMTANTESCDLSADIDESISDTKQVISKAEGNA